MSQNALDTGGGGGESKMSENEHPIPTSGARIEGHLNLNEEVVKKMMRDQLQNNAKKLKTAFIGQIELKLEEMVDEMVDLLRKSEVQPNTVSSTRDKRKSRESGKLPEKEFLSRPSPLTELLEVPHFKTIQNIVIASLALFILNSFITELLQTGTVDLGIEGFMFAFGKAHITFGILIGMHLSTLIFVYQIFSAWSKYRQNLDKASARILDYCALGGFISFLVALIYIPALIMWKNPLPPGSGATVTAEQCRLLMKVYAFVRSNAPRALNMKSPLPDASSVDDEVDHDRKSKSSNATKSTLRNRFPVEEKEKQCLNEFECSKDQSSPCPDFSKYLYFLYAPTLIYKDSYPRSSKISWNIVSWNFTQVFCCIWYINFIMGRCKGYFENFGHPDHPMNITQFVQTIFALMLPGIMTLVLSFFLLLHAWHNAFAEMLRFGDRQFYKDWWNCSSFASYYKTWNIIVHDWLYTYVFKDAWEIGLGKKHSAIPTTLVFLISSLFHEYILSFTFNFFFPVLLTLFGGFGFALVFIKSGKQNGVGNVLMWMSLMAGTGIIFALYGFEYFARRNCPLSDDVSAWDFFKPRALSLDCGALVMSFN